MAKCCHHGVMMLKCRLRSPTTIHGTQTRSLSPSQQAVERHRSLQQVAHLLRAIIFPLRVATVGCMRALKHLRHSFVCTHAKIKCCTLICCLLQIPRTHSPRFTPQHWRSFDATDANKVNNTILQVLHPTTCLYCDNSCGPTITK